MPGSDWERRVMTSKMRGVAGLLRRGVTRQLVAAVALGMALGAGFSASAKPPAGQPAPPPVKPVDVAAVRDKLLVLTDGKGHFVAVTPMGVDPEGFFYGDGKRFFQLRRAGGSRDGEVWERSFIDPRLTDGGHEEGMGFVAFRNGGYSVQCGPRTTKLTLVDAAAKATLLQTASFERSLRQRRPYALARDDRGRYYYVDRGYHPEDKDNFRLYAGPKGNLKLQKMTNVVSDSQGDLFATKTGSLRLVLNREPKSLIWIAGKGQSPLVQVPVDFNVNVASIYNDFGVYAGERLGTPCDDL